VVVKTLLRDIKVCLVKEVTAVRRDEENHGGRTYCLTYSSLLPTAQFKWVMVTGTFILILARTIE
jgi:hypothetical protein